MAIGAKALVRSGVLPISVEVEEEDDPDVAELLQTEQCVWWHVALEHDLGSRGRCQKPLARRSCSKVIELSPLAISFSAFLSFMLAPTQLLKHERMAPIGCKNTPLLVSSLSSITRRSSYKSSSREGL